MNRTLLSTLTMLAAPTAPVNDAQARGGVVVDFTGDRASVASARAPGPDFAAARWRERVGGGNRRSAP